MPRRDITINFQNKRKIFGGKLHHNHKETSISSSSNSLPLSIEFSFKELKLFLNAHMSHEDSSQSYTFLEYPLMLGDTTRDHSCANSLYDSRMNDYNSYVDNVDSFVIGVENKEEHMLGVFENKGKSLEKELFNLQEETTMSFSLNPSSVCPPKVKTIKGSRNGIKWNKNDENRIVGKKICTYLAWQVAYYHRISRSVQDLLSWIQELKTLIPYFDLQLGDSRDDLRRYSELQFAAPRIQS
ncbi:hypothetical protein M9H77_29650 [Catharanthus roseus]|uniref:Uncharacterized protein n=1 Tax=Catharanthus roseus TaxID=4058 RepID=A0ACB9ZZ91_CATRO|nr:hypothetical protein M9H77_29650 [Catharanthus roseus]